MPGLLLRVQTRKNKKMWGVRHVFGGQSDHTAKRRDHLGVCPGLGLYDAREKARNVLRDLEAGRDPRVPVDAVPNRSLGELADQFAREIASELTSGGRPTVEVEVLGTPRRLSVAAEHHLSRIAQEALTNAVRHAQASRVSVSLAFAGNEVELTVCDDGRGIPPEPPGHGFHFGLSGMRERARALETRLEADSAPGQGTTIRVRWSGKLAGAAGVPEA